MLAVRSLHVYVLFVDRFLPLILIFLCVCEKKKFEIEIIKVHEAHEGLVKLSERREQLERLARHKLQAEVKRLTDLNADLKDQVDVLSTQIANRAIPTDNTDALRKELNKRDVFIAQLVSQSKIICFVYVAFLVYF